MIAEFHTEAPYLMADASIPLEPSLISLIDNKANKECGDTALRYSSTYIRQLNNHIDGFCSLSISEIESKIHYLVGCLTITLDMPMSNLEFLRVRRCEVKKFEHVQELSYIKPTTKNSPGLGRMNRDGQALFYAALAVKKDDTALRVALFETGSKNLDHLNVLRSHQKSGCDLKMRVIGIWDQITGGDKPYYLDKKIFAYYEKASNFMEEKFEPDLLIAYQFTDRFFADVLSRKGSENLYQVTSTISSAILEGDICDGVLYSSVGAKREPVVALKPASVDNKLVHQWVADISVEKQFGYEFYKYRTLGKTKSIDVQSGHLIW
jgi:hypothetical protein